jgi:hypothetical protein
MMAGSCGGTAAAAGLNRPGAARSHGGRHDRALLLASRDPWFTPPGWAGSPAEPWSTPFRRADREVQRDLEGQLPTGTGRYQQDSRADGLGCLRLMRLQGVSRAAV